MAPSHCPHCGSSVMIRTDVFCAACQEPLDEPSERPRTPEEQAKFRRGNAKEVVTALEDAHQWGYVLVVGLVALAGVSTYLLRGVFQLVFQPKQPGHGAFKTHGTV